MSDDDGSAAYATLDALEARWGTAKGILFASFPMLVGGDYSSVALYDLPDGGELAVTIDLIESGSQIANERGRYEFAFASRASDRVGSDLISRLARYSFEAVVESGHTMDLPPDAAPKRSNIRGLAFEHFGELDIEGGDAHVLLVVGITLDELDAIKLSGDPTVLQLLREDGVFPYTDWKRRSVLRRR